MNFDGAARKEGARAGVLIKPSMGEPNIFSYKLQFKCINNVVEYEALVLGLKVLKNIQCQRMRIRGDSDLIISQVQGKYQTKNLRLTLYKNFVLELVKGFKECKFLVIPKKENF